MLLSHSPPSAAAAQELLTQVKSILPHCCLCRGARPHGRSSVGVLRAGKEPRELIWVGVPVGCSTLGLGILPRAPHCPAVGPTPAWQLPGHCRLLAGSTAPLLHAQEAPRSWWHRPWIPARGVPGLAAAGDGRARSTAGTSCIHIATKRLICKINTAKPTLADPSQGGNLSTGCAVLWASTRASTRAASTPKPQAPRSPKAPCEQRLCAAPLIPSQGKGRIPGQFT